MKVAWCFLLLAILTATVMNHASEEVAEKGQKKVAEKSIIDDLKVAEKSIIDDLKIFGKKVKEDFEKLGRQIGKVTYIDRSLRSRHTRGVHPLRIVGATTHKET